MHGKELENTTNGTDKNTQNYSDFIQWENYISGTIHYIHYLTIKK